MTFYLTDAGYGLCFERELVHKENKVIFTFVGKTIDYVCLDGRFYPVKDGRAEIPLAELPEVFSLSAHERSRGVRYHCDAVTRLAAESEGCEYLAPLSDCESRLLLALSAKLTAFEERLSRAEGDLARAIAAQNRQPITFGGAYEP